MVIGEVAGVVLGRAVRGAIHNSGVRVADSIIGVALQLVVVMVAAWLLASPLTSSDQPQLAAAVRGLKILSEVDKYAPEWLKSVPKRMSGLLSNSGSATGAAAFGKTPIQTVDVPDASLADSIAVANARPSVVKIRGVAQACQKVLEGTGFVIALNRVMSNAHVVAGSDSVTVEADGQSYEGSVVSTTRTRTSRSWMCRICRCGRWCSRSSRPARVLGRGGARLPGEAISWRPRRGSGDHRTQRPGHLPHHHRQPRGVHDQGTVRQGIRVVR